MRIDDLIWSDQSIEHIAHHGVEPQEVQEVVFSPTHVTRARGGTFRVIGRTWGGRFLTIYVSPRGGGLYFVVTARDATPVERRAYRSHHRG